jgi:hypothetical protein
MATKNYRGVNRETIRMQETKGLLPCCGSLKPELIGQHINDQPKNILPLITPTGCIVHSVVVRQLLINYRLIIN